MSNGEVRWSDWWWIRIFDSASWSKQELLAAGAYGLVFVVVAMLSAIGVCFVLHGLQFGWTVCVVGSASFALVYATYYVCGLTRELFPNVVRNGQVQAASRLGLVAPERPKYVKKRLWWVSYRGGYGWSAEELWVRNVILTVAAIVFVPSVLFLVAFLQNDLRFSKRDSVVISMVLLLPAAFAIGRRFCVWMWPDYAKAADDNANKRFNEN